MPLFVFLFLSIYSFDFLHSPPNGKFCDDDGKHIGQMVNERKLKSKTESRRRRLCMCADLATSCLKGR